jgi:hypothetical protein
MPQFQKQNLRLRSPRRPRAAIRHRERVPTRPVLQAAAHALFRSGEDTVLPTACEALINPLLCDGQGLGISGFSGCDRARARIVEILLAIALFRRYHHDGSWDPSSGLERV